MVTSVLEYNSEAGFLQSSFVEFVKCWSMGTNSTFHVESRNGEAYLNFSAYLGSPRNVHFYQPNKKIKPKSERKTKRDNERAAIFQAKMNQSLHSNHSSSTPQMKNTNISDTTDNSECNIDIDENEASDTTSDNILDNIPDDVSDSETVIPEDDDFDTRTFSQQNNQPTIPAPVIAQHSASVENSANHSIHGEGSNVAVQFSCTSP